MENQEITTLVARITTAKNVTAKLVEKTREFAEYVQNAMEENGVKSVLNGKYELQTLNASAGSDTSLYARTENEYASFYVCLDSSNLSSTNESVFLRGDFSARYNLPSRSNILEFIGDAKAILIELADMDKMPELPEIK
ncbi:MAG: hypothetical protein OEM38_00415 [Gammaproteobacteria bacterium]|nr:hypothetical protein [Gammaproteobacteria bacterium]